MNQTLNAKMRARMEEVRAQVAERDDLIEVIAIALLTRKNVFILGDTGQAKSYAVNLFREGITGARQFERLMSKQTDEEALFGRLDLSSLIPGGVPDEVLSRDSRYQAMQSSTERPSPHSTAARPGRLFGARFPTATSAFWMRYSRRRTGF